MSNTIDTTKQHIKKLLSLNSLPCKEAVQWYLEVGIADKYELVDAAQPEWQDWVTQHTRNAEILSHLAKSTYENVRRNVAWNQCASDETLKMLAKDANAFVRVTVACNPNTSEEALGMLAKDSEYFVRSQVARNPNTPIKTLEMLANDSDYYVRSQVAANPNTRQ